MSIENMTPEEYKALKGGLIRKHPKKREPSAGEERMASQLNALKIPYEREYRFYTPHRQWRFDFALVEHKIAIEVEGGIWVQGAHSRGKHFESDCEKYNTAAALGWKVLRFSTGMVKSGAALRFIERIKSLKA